MLTSEQIPRHLMNPRHSEDTRIAINRLALLDHVILTRPLLLIQLCRTEYDDGMLAVRGVVEGESGRKSLFDGAADWVLLVFVRVWPPEERTVGDDVFGVPGTFWECFFAGTCCFGGVWLAILKGFCWSR